MSGIAFDFVFVFVVLLLFHAVATVFQLYVVSDMMYEMKRRETEPTLLMIYEIFNLPHHIGLV